MSLFGGALNKAAIETVRGIVREELRTELQRILNPTFIQLVTEGAQDMEVLLDAALAAETKCDELKFTVDLLEKAVADLQVRLPK